MTPDLWALLATIGLAIVQIGTASILTLRQLGPAWVAGNRDEPREVIGVSGRYVRAHRNLLEIFPQFLAALFLVHAVGEPSAWSFWGAWVFFAARMAYVPAYAHGPPGLRSIFWQAAQFGIIAILIDVFV